MKRLFVECVLPEIDGRFHYHLPAALDRKRIEAGSRLLVPFGRGWKVGFFIRRVKKPDVAITKPILALLDEHSLIRPTLFKLLLWISDYYFTPLGALIKTALPKGIHVVPRRRYILTDDGRVHSEKKLSTRQQEIIDFLSDKGTCTEHRIRKFLGANGLNRTLSTLKKTGIIKETWEVDPPPVQPKIRRMIALKGPAEEVLSLVSGLQRTAPKQADILNRLMSVDGIMLLTDFEEGSERAAVRRLLQKGVVKQIEEVVSRKPGRENSFRKKGRIILNKDQGAAVDTIVEAIEKESFAPFLLHGVTGSGKTEVYLRAIEAVIEKGKSAILLLPEIGLTTHIAARFYERFGERVALLHSGLSAGERYDEWRRISEGKVGLAIGARSGIFAPFKSVGAIIIDEEHDSSYRQEEGSRYNARDVALVRGRDENAVVILGSATPSFESYHNSQTGKYRYLHLPERIDKRPLPTVNLVDLKERGDWVRPFFTKALVSAIEKRLTAKEQVLLFVNRRGFSPFLLCRDCGHTPTCTRCSVSLTFHKEVKRLRCHYCGFQSTPPTICPECNGVDINYLGIGTEQVEENIRALFPTARVARLDRDTVQKKGAHGKILGAMEREETDILIGTQMIAKGHDFPKVTLVGVLSADMSLHLPDFRSSERTFQLLTQVAGRAGRGERPGEVVIQTFQPENLTIQAARTQNYTAFYKQEIDSRREGNYPPFSRLALLLIQHSREDMSVSGAASLAEMIRRSLPGKGVKMLGPAPAPLIRLKQAYRYQIFMKGEGQQRIATVLRSVLERWRRTSKRGARIEVEIDPQNFV